MVRLAVELSYLDKIEKLEADNERLRAELGAACDALYNGFEPDNQSRAWHRAKAALEQKVDPK
jgi:hypothetical protein